MSKSTWHYNLIQKGTGKFKYLELHEVYIGMGGVGGISWTVEPATIGGTTKEEVIAVLKTMLKDVKYHGVVKEKGGTLVLIKS